MDDGDILSVVDRIYEAVVDPRLLPETVSLVSRYVGGLGGVLIPMSASFGGQVIPSPEMIEATALYEREWWRFNRRVDRGINNQLRGLVTDLDMFSQAEMSRDPFYQDFLKPQGIGHFLGHVSTPTPGRAVSLSVQRDIRKGTFEQRDRERLQILGPHVSRALSVLTKVGGQQRVRTSMTLVVDQIDAGIILLDDRGIVTFVSAAAERFFGRTFNVRHGMLRCASPSAQRSLDRLIASIMPKSGKLPRGGIALQREDGQSPIFVQAIPIKASTTDQIESVLLGPGGGLLLLHDLSAQNDGSIQDAFKMMGLTAGQARIAELIGQGQTIRQAAEALGIKEDTARHVLKSIFSKLNISRQSQLVAIATRLSILGLEK